MQQQKITKINTSWFYGGSKGWHYLDENSIKDKKKYYHLINIKECNNKAKDKKFLVSTVMMWKSH